SIDNRLGQLLLPWSRQQSLPSGGTTLAPEAPPVAMRQTQNGGRGDHEVSRRYPAPKVWSRPTHNADYQAFVGDTVSLLREPDVLIAHVRFDERDVETEQGAASVAPADERAGSRSATPTTTAPHLDSTVKTRLLHRESVYGMEGVLPGSLAGTTGR